MRRFITVGPASPRAGAASETSIVIGGDVQRAASNMSNVSKSLPWSNQAAPDLLSQAVAILSREVARLPSSLGGPGVSSGLPGGLPSPEMPGGFGDLAGLVGPVVGAQNPLPGPGKDDLRRQAHEVLAGLFGLLGQFMVNPAPPYPHTAEVPGTPWDNLQIPSGAAYPSTKGSAPLPGFDMDALRRQAHELVESLLVTFRDSTDEQGPATESKVPLLQCAAPVQAGSVATTTVTIANEESTPSQVSLYFTNFTDSSGYEIPSLRVTCSPRVVSIPAKGQAEFEIKIMLPQQTPAGTYSGLIQAMGSKYVKAVLSVQVL